MTEPRKKGIADLRHGEATVYFASLPHRVPTGWRFDEWPTVGVLLKVGCTGNLEQRLSFLRSAHRGASLIASVPGDRHLERLVLDRLRAFRHLRSGGEEIFVATPAVLSLVGAAMRGPSALAEELAR